MTTNHVNLSDNNLIPLPRLLLAFVAIGLWLGLAFYLSGQNGEETVKLSGGIATWLQGHLFPCMELALLHHLLSRCAHLAIYGVAGMLLFFALRMNRCRKAYLVNIAVLMQVTIFDEAHKVPILGRHCDMFEIGLNIFGVLLGTFTCWVIAQIAAHIRGRRETKRQNAY